MKLLLFYRPLLLLRRLQYSLQRPALPASVSDLAYTARSAVQLNGTGADISREIVSCPPIRVSRIKQYHVYRCGRKNRIYNISSNYLCPVPCFVQWHLTCLSIFTYHYDTHKSLTRGVAAKPS